MPRRWRGVLITEGQETEDHRIFVPGSGTWRDLPLTFSAIFEGGFGHENAVPVSTIDVIERRGADIYAEGTIAEGDPDGERFANLLEQGILRGVSIDYNGEVQVEVVSKEDGTVLPPDVGMEALWGPEGENYYVRETWTAYQIMSACALSTPAFSTAVIEIVPEAAAPAPSPAAPPPPAAASGASEALAAIDAVAVDDEVTWTEDDGTVRTGTVTEVDTEAEEVTVQPYDADGNPDGDPVTLPVADVTVVPPAAEAEAAPLFPALSSRVAAAAHPRPALAAMLARERGDVVQASAFNPHGAVIQASVAWDEGPPAEWFEPLNLDTPTPLTITDEGEVYGHIALSGQCHAGFAAGQFSECVMPQPSPTGYAMFHGGQVRCANGERVRVGTLAMDCGHAPAGRPGRRPSVASVQAFYENTGLQVAWLRAHDGPLGPEVHGAVRSGVAVSDLRRAMASRPSGDWRDQGAGLDLLGLVQVNVPAYPVYEVEDGEAVVLLASLAPYESTVLPAAGEAAPAGCDGSCGCSGACRALEEHAARWAGLRGSQRARLAGLDRAMHEPVNV